MYYYQNTRPCQGRRRPANRARARRVMARRIKQRALLLLDLAAIMAVSFAVVFGFMAMLVCWS